MASRVLCVHVADYKVVLVFSRAYEAVGGVGGLPSDYSRSIVHVGIQVNVPAILSDTAGDDVGDMAMGCDRGSG